MTKHERILVAAFASLTALAGCGDAGAAAAGWTGTVDTLANGAVLVSNPERGLWDEATRWSLQEELRIGSADVEGPDLFGEVSGLAVDSLGRIYVAEGQALEVRVFDPDGSHVRTIGRKGGGPGEFEAISGMGWGPDGNLWVMDHRNSRLAVFDTAGTYVTSHRRPGGYVRIPWQGGFDRHGRVYDFTASGAPELRQVFVRFDSQMAPLDTFWIPEFENEAFSLTGDDGRRRVSVYVPFTPSQAVTFDDEGHVWIGTSDRYRIHRLSFAGDTLGVVERRYSPIPVTEAEKDEHLERFEWFTRQGGQLDRRRIPDTKPAFTNFFVDGGGYLWVGASRAEADPMGFDVFDPAGRYLGRVSVPEGTRWASQPLVVGDRMYAVTVDELDVPYVVRYRIGGRTAD